MAWVERNGKYYRVRYYADDGTIASISDRYSEEEARQVADEITVDQRRGEFIDPRNGGTPLETWAADWFAALDVAASTEAQYDSSWRNHVKPRWGGVALADITTVEVRKWEKRLRREHPASMVDTIMKPLRMMLEDAAEERLIPINPARARKRGRRVRREETERVWVTPVQALMVADAARDHAGSWARTLILTAAWTGMRWGELAGLAWRNVHLQADRPYIYVHPKTGRLQELGGKFELGPPKSEAGGRDVLLPPFLVDELALHKAAHGGEFVFVSPEGTWLRRSNFGRRVLRPVCDGREALNAKRGRPAQPEIPALAAGLSMHGFKHSHNTWLISMGVPDVARYKRLGWRISDAVQRTYSHVSGEVEARLVEGLENAYQRAVAEAVAEADRAAADGLPAGVSEPVQDRS